jgi:hypothetical protein
LQSDIKPVGSINKKEALLSEVVLVQATKEHTLLLLVKILETLTQVIILLQLASLLEVLDRVQNP